jgi:hypothetical protein
MTESHLQADALLTEFNIPEDFTREESDLLLDLFRLHANRLPPDWHLRKNNELQNILYWSIRFDQVQLTSSILEQLSHLQKNDNASFQSFLDDNTADSDTSILALAFDTSGSNPNNARLRIITELLDHRDIVEPLLNHESRLENERNQGCLHYAAVHGVLMVFQKLQEWYGERLAEWLQNYQKGELDSLTPLDIAIEKGNVEIVKILITSYQAPQPIRDDRANLELLPGTSILHKALVVPSPNREIVDLIMQHYPELLGQYNKDVKTPLMELRDKIETRQSRRYRADPMPTGDAKQMRTYLEIQLFRSNWPISLINRCLGLELDGRKYFE